MRKTVILLLLLSILFVGVSCHKHTFSDQWSSDANSHWHAATCNHDVTADSAAHTWDNGTITKEPTCTEEGVRTYTCTVCKATRTESVAASGQHSYVKGICTGCGDSLLEGEWKIDMKATLDGLIEQYLSNYFNKEEVEKNYDMYYGMALVEAATAIEGEDADFFIIGFNGTNCTMTYYGSGIVCQYSISDANELNLTYQGETIKLGAFDENYTKLTCAENSEFAGLVLVKNPEPMPRLVWSELYSRNPSAENIKALIADGADVNAGRGSYGKTALMYAINEELYDIATILIEAGADVNATDEDGKTALCYELSNYDDASVDVVNAMIAHGADVDEGKLSYDRSPLMFACGNCSDEIKLALIENSKNINAMNGDGKTALCYELSNYDDASVDVVKAMIAHGADVDEGKLSYDRSPLMFACGNCSDEIKLALIENSKNINAMNGDGKTALCYELSNYDDASVDVVKAMIAHGADVDEGTLSYGRSPLMFACGNCSNEIKLALIESSKNINAKDEDGLTALVYELRNYDKASIDVVKALIAHGIDVNASQIYGRSAKEFAERNCSAEIAALL